MNFWLAETVPIEDWSDYVMADMHWITSACVDSGCRYNPGLPCWEQVLKCWKSIVYKQECPVQVICCRDVEAVLIKGYYAQTIVSLYRKKERKKKSKKVERICKHEISSKSVMVVANIRVSLQFCGNAALKRRITNTERTKRAREKYILCLFIFTKKMLIVGLIV